MSIADNERDTGGAKWSVSTAPHREMERTELTGDGFSLSGLLRDGEAGDLVGSGAGTGFVVGGVESRAA